MTGWKHFPRWTGGLNCCSKKTRRRKFSTRSRWNGMDSFKPCFRARRTRERIMSILGSGFIQTPLNDLEPVALRRWFSQRENRHLKMRGENFLQFFRVAHQLGDALQEPAGGAAIQHAVVEAQ